MKKLHFTFSVLFILLAFTLVQWGGISIVKASPEIYQGNLILEGNNVTIIEGVFDINGSIIVEENATLLLKDALLNFTQTEYARANGTGPVISAWQFHLSSPGSEAKACAETSTSIMFTSRS